MIFNIFVFIVALSIEGIATTISVIGLSTLFGSNLLIIALAIALDFAKIATVSLLYTYWTRLSKLMKGYALIAAAVTMTITSTGAAGYLSGEFQKVIVGTKEGELKVSVYKEQQAKYELRKKQIDDQIANLSPKTTVSQRLRLMNGFKEEQRTLDTKIAEIDKNLPQQQLDQIGTESKAGPILYVAKAFNITVEEAVKYVILMIIFVFDPLAIFLIIAGNFLWAGRKREIAALRNGYREEDAGAKVVPPFVAKLNDDDNVNNVHIDENGVEHHPQMPAAMKIQKGPIVLEGEDGPKDVDLGPVEYDDMSPKIIDRGPYIQPDEPWPRSIPPILDEPTEVIEEPAIYKPDYSPVDPEPPIYEHLIPTAQQVETPETTLEEKKLETFDPEKHGGEFPTPEDTTARPQITRSSLQGIAADPRTVVDARRRDGFLPSKAFTTPSKKS